MQLSSGPPPERCTRASHERTNCSAVPEPGSSEAQRPRSPGGEQRHRPANEEQTDREPNGSLSVVDTRQQPDGAEREWRGEQQEEIEIAYPERLPRKAIEERRGEQHQADSECRKIEQLVGAKVVGAQKEVQKPGSGERPRKKRKK